MTKVASGLAVWPIILFSLIGLAAHAEVTVRTGKAKCLIEIDGKPYLAGACNIDSIGSDGSFSVGTGSRPSKYFAYVNFGDGKFIGSWNGSSGGSHAHAALGELTKSGDCWTNEREAGKTIPITSKRSYIIPRAKICVSGNVSSMTAAPPSEATKANPQPEDGIYFVANAGPPSGGLAMYSAPTMSLKDRIGELQNGTHLRVLERLPNGFWRVKVVSSGQEGWALSQRGGPKWISCCASTGVTLSGFPVVIGFTRAALEKLSAMKELVTIQARYYADTGVGPFEGIQIAEKTITVMPGEEATFPSVDVANDLIAKFRGAPIKVNLDAFSARKASSSNVLNCGVYQDDAAHAAARGVIVRCRLLGEKRE